MLFRSSITHTLTGTGATISNIGMARMYSGYVTGQGNLGRVDTAAMVHVPSGWVSANTSLVTNAYSLFVEDTRSSITNYGPQNQYATFTSNAAVVLTSANLSLGNYQEKQYSLGTTSGNLSINYNNGTVQTATLNGDIQLWSNNFTNFIAGRSITLILTQDATGSRVLNTTNLKYAGGITTLSTAANSIDVMNIYYDGTNYLTALVKGYV